MTTAISSEGKDQSAIPGQESVCLAEYSMVLKTPVVTQGMDITADPSCSRTTDTDMALGNSSDPDVSVAPGGNLPDKHGPGHGVVLRDRNVSRWPARPWSSK